MTEKQGLSAVGHRTQLRDNAEKLIHSGAAPSVGGGALGVDALELLYRRASNPEFAADALKLLHELQTHQVELDLLFDQLQASEEELAEELAHYKALYDLAPVPYIIVDSSGRLVESNQAAGKLFGLSAERLSERYLNDLLSPSSRATVNSMIQEVVSSKSGLSCSAELSGDLGVDGPLAIEATLGSFDDRVLLVLSPGSANPGS